MPLPQPSASSFAVDTQQAGFTIIEVLVTALITALLATAVATALISQTHASGDQRLRSEADTLADQAQDRLRGLSDQALTGMVGSSASSQSQTVNGVTFPGAASGPLQQASGKARGARSSIDYFNATTKVSWAEGVNSSTQSATATTLISRPVTGLLETSVTDPTGSGLAGVTVTATPPSGSAQTTPTDGSGCATLAGLSAGNYTVQVTKTGYLNYQDVSSPTASAAVTSTGSTATATFGLGLAGSLTSTFAASNGSASYTGEADALSAAGTSTTYGTYTAVQTNASGAPVTSFGSSLYPGNVASTGSTSASYAGNYSIYGGQCSYQNPFASVTSTNLASVSPGGTSAVTVNEPFLYIAKTTYNGNAVRPNDIVLTYSASSSTCVDSYQASIASGSGGSAPSTGWLLNPGQPYAPSGDLTVCADYTSGTKTHYNSTTVSNTSLTGVNPTASGITLSLSKTSSSGCE